MKLKEIYLTDEQLADPDFKKLNLACGRRVYPGEGWINLDLVECEGVTPCNIFNLDWPVALGTIDYLLASLYLLSRLSDEALIEVWGPNPDRRDTLQYVGHTRLIGPLSFSEYTQPHTRLSSLENIESRRDYNIEMIHMERRRCIHLGPVNDYHFNKYLGEGWRDRLSIVLGRKDEIRMVFRVTKEDGK